MCTLRFLCLLCGKDNMRLKAPYPSPITTMTTTRSVIETRIRRKSKAIPRIVSMAAYIVARNRPHRPTRQAKGSRPHLPTLRQAKASGATCPLRPCPRGRAGMYLPGQKSPRHSPSIASGGECQTPRRTPGSRQTGQAPGRARGLGQLAGLLDQGAAASTPGP